MKYREFFQVEMIHPYFSGMPKDLVLIPDNDTKNLLINLGYILKKEADGIKVLAPIHPENNTFPALDEKDVFTFYIYPKSADIQEITDFSGIENGSIISFTNLDQDGSELITTQIEKKETFQGFSAIANIVITGNKIKTNSVEPIKFQARFKAKSIKWKYYFVSNTEDATISLESRDDQITFTEITLDESTADQIINSIRLNFPNSPIKLFESKGLVPYSSTPIKNIKLLQDGDILINHLPNPRLEQQGIQIIKIK
ncbi:hypothetical protein [Aquimarina litoralis]|uniref:hypothetical protein n=1 Tax=Aquimarina litoralis TaxID=584605 RepID=UPI001C587A2F|nr:hypothetical protein [Aquimarina litoralis]MBW1297059.1 hypothetical protein [Aquimarina litoralis]